MVDQVCNLLLVLALVVLGLWLNSKSNSVTDPQSKKNYQMWAYLSWGVALVLGAYCYLNNNKEKASMYGRGDTGDSYGNQGYGGYRRGRMCGLRH